MTEMKGTPITRKVGSVIRVGWGAVGYTVDLDVANKYHTARVFLFILALVVGVGVAVGVDYVLYTFVANKASQYVPVINGSPELIRLVIYGLTLVCGGLIYLQIVASVGKSMVKGQQPVDEGFSFYEQRQHAALKRGIDLLMLIVALSVLLFAPISMSLSVQFFSVSVVGVLLLEGLFFRFIRPQKFKPHRSG